MSATAPEATARYKHSLNSAQKAETYLPWGLLPRTLCKKKSTRMSTKDSIKARLQCGRDVEIFSMGISNSFDQHAR